MIAARRSLDAADDAPAAAVAGVEAGADAEVATEDEIGAAAGGGMRGKSSPEDGGSIAPDDFGWSPILAR